MTVGVELQNFSERTHWTALQQAACVCFVGDWRLSQLLRNDVLLHIGRPQTIRDTPKTSICLSCASYVSPIFHYFFLQPVRPRLLSTVRWVMQLVLFFVVFFAATESRTASCVSVGPITTHDVTSTCCIFLSDRLLVGDRRFWSTENPQHQTLRRGKRNAARHVQQQHELSQTYGCMLTAYAVFFCDEIENQQLLFTCSDSETWSVMKFALHFRLVFAVLF